MTAAPEDQNGLREALASAEAERDAARETNRELHRRLQAVEGPLLRRAVKAERAATFWLERRRYHGGRAAEAARRLDAAMGQGLAWREEARLAAASLRAAEAEITRLKEGMEAAVGALKMAEDVMSRSPFSTMRIWPNGTGSQEGITTIRTALATLSQEHPHG